MQKKDYIKKCYGDDIGYSFHEANEKLEKLNQSPLTAKYDHVTIEDDPRGGFIIAAYYN